jgi:squalene-associated FAD-dependent desaturase
VRVAVVGAGWAGIACAVEATKRGHRVTLFEAARNAGGRARRVEHAEPGAPDFPLDNGQHILIGAYRDTLALMRTVGVDPEAALLRMPLTLRHPDGTGLAVPAGLPPPLDLLAGIATARGWTWRDKASLLRTAWQWRRAGFRCGDHVDVNALCARLTARVRDEVIDPLCFSALNTPPDRASGQVFLTVLRDALFGERGGADLLIPRVDLGALLPDPALAWLARHGATVRLATRIHALERIAASARADGVHGTGWQVAGSAFDHVVLATPPWDGARLVRTSGIQAGAWLDATDALKFEAIATVYASHALPTRAPVQALRASPGAPAQFVFDRASLMGHDGVLALVVSASTTPRDLLERQVLAQARSSLRQPALRPLRTIVEKRATYACTPGLSRPSARLAGDLSACGDYVAGPYPATLEGAVRSGLAAARAMVA